MAIARDLLCETLRRQRAFGGAVQGIEGVSGEVWLGRALLSGYPLEIQLRAGTAVSGTVLAFAEAARKAACRFPSLVCAGEELLDALLRQGSWSGAAK